MLLGLKYLFVYNLIAMLDDKKIESHAQAILGKDFKFRPYQLDAVKHIVENAVSGVKHTMLEAPTGSGKSLTALIAAYVLWREFGKKSYILVSDLSLHRQYENDMLRLNDSSCFGCIKGKENYTCQLNGCKASQSVCSLRGVSFHAMQRNPGFFPCMRSCQYIHDCIKATAAPVTLMTYQLYFIQRNYVEDSLFGGKNPNFPMRDLAVCDECHKLSDICQAHFAPKISIERPQWMDVIDRYAHIASYESDRKWIVNRILDSASSDELMEHVHEYESYVKEYADANESIRRSLSKKRHLVKLERMALLAGNRARQEHCKLEDLIKFVDERNTSDCVVKTSSDDGITLNFVLDDVMLQKYFHKKTGCELLMSATVGNFSTYARLNGLDKKSSRAIALPSTFDFSHSPVMFSCDNKMSYDEKDSSMKNIADEVISICKDNEKVRGIIQTGTYANTRSLMSMLPEEVSKRCIVYNSSKEKTAMLRKFLDKGLDSDDNSILVGPTLIEGLNFPDGLCRFQICIKVPYAFLGSEYVQKKMKYAEGWYEYDVLNKICQGIGRGVRHEHDWCKTYILDGCISWLVEKLDKMSVLHGRFKKMC